MIEKNSFDFDIAELELLCSRTPSMVMWLGKCRQPTGKYGLSIWLESVASRPSRAPSHPMMRRRLAGL